MSATDTEAEARARVYVPPVRSASTPNEGDDRKKFLEHLRTVHFSLVTTCLLLLLGATLTPSFELQNAYRQAREIQASYDDLDAWLRKQFDPHLPTQIYNRVARNSPIFTDGKARYQALRGTVYPVRGGVGTFDFAPEVRRMLYSTRDSTRSGPTLIDFRNRWQALESFSALSWVAGWDSVGLEITPVDTTGRTSYWIALSSPPGPVYQFSNELEDAELVNEEGRWSLMLTYSQQPTRFRSDTLRRAVLPIRSMRIPLKVQPIRMDLQRAFINSRMLPWRPGPFEEAFPELAEYYTDIGSLDLKALENHLRKLRMQERQNITLFGAAIPADSLRTWGMLVLILVQLYMLVHLVQFKHAWGSFLDNRFAWMGSNDDPFARGLFLLSLLILPISTSLYLTVTAVQYRLNDAQVTLLAAGTLSGAILAVLAVSHVVQANQPQRRQWNPPA